MSARAKVTLRAKVSSCNFVHSCNFVPSCNFVRSCKFDSYPSYQQRSKVLNKYEHPGYDDKYIQMNVAVLQLKTRLYFDSLIRPCRTKCDVVEFGRTGLDPEVSPHF